MQTVKSTVYMYNITKCIRVAKAGNTLLFERQVSFGVSQTQLQPPVKPERSYLLLSYIALQAS